jgi:hypothetical protein
LDLTVIVQIEGLISNFRCHYQLAAVLECEPFLFSADFIEDRFISSHRPIKTAFDSPLFISAGSFGSKSADVGLHPMTAQILDDITLVLTNVRSITLGDKPEDQLNSILLAATMTLERISSLRSANEDNHPATKDYMYEACRLAALLYLKAITSFTQFSKLCHYDELQEMFAVLTQVPLPRWKPLAGVWLFILLSINPPKEDFYPGPNFSTFLKRSAFFMASWDWQSFVNIMETYLCVQRWIRYPRASRPQLSDTASYVRDLEDV